MTVKEQFKKIVGETISEIKGMKREQLKESLRPVVTKILKEMVSSNNTPEPDKDEETKINKQFAKDGNERLDKGKMEQEEEIVKLVKPIAPEAKVFWDDHSELAIDNRDLFRMRITPKFENNYDIDLMLKMVDRVRAIGLTWKQVKDFVKVNLTDFENKTVADKAKQKAMDHLKDQSDKRAADLPDSSVKVKKLSNEPQKDGDTLAKDQVKDEDDLPHKPMKTAKTPKRQAEYGESKPKAPKHDNDKELVKKMPGKKRS